MIPDGIDLHLVSSLDATSEALRDCVSGRRILLIDTAVRGEGRELPENEPLPLEGVGAHVEVCDLRCGGQASVHQKLERADGCVLLGGNTFVLMHAMREISFDEIVRARAGQGDEPFFMIGESAGAVVCGSSISHAAEMDEPDAAPEIVSKGIGWVDARILPHRGCPFWGYAEKVEEIIRADNDPGSLMVLDEDELRSFPSQVSAPRP